MIVFESLRDQLTASRRELEFQRQSALLAGEALKKAESELENFHRLADPQSEASVAERHMLEARLAQAQKIAQSTSGYLAELRRVEAGLWEQFIRFTDPRDLLSRWSDRHPILLFPLRLETRFKTSPEGQPQLWVRIFPDACLVDTFETALTEAEVENGRRFWAGIWRASGDEGLERAAWRELVAAHGSGRAGWIVRSYRPKAPGEQPFKANSWDLLLIIPADDPPPPFVLAQAQKFWEAYWKAGDDAAARQRAYANLEADTSVAEARRMFEEFRPFNLDDAPQTPRTRAEVGITVKVLRLPADGEIETRRSSWSRAPRVELLPERFVVVGYWDGGDPLVAVGSPVHTPLIAGPDPNAPDEEQLQADGDSLRIPDNMAWMFNFERAMQVGMALRIDLNPQQAANGFTRLVVLGLRFADSPRQGRRDLRNLLERHLHSRGGLELLPQGIPTNNTEDGAAGYSFRGDPEAGYAAFYCEEPQYTPENDLLLRRDGQWLASALGLDDDFVARIPNAGGTDQLEARAMQIALWPGTLGYTLRSLLSPLISSRDVAAARRFFTRYVSGRGPLPALRIGGQPYGILPTADFTRLCAFPTRDRRDDSRTGMVELPSIFLARLCAILQQIHTDWKPLLEAISFIGKPGADPHQTLLDVLGLHPGSVEYHPLLAESLDHQYNVLSLFDHRAAQDLAGEFPFELALALLRDFGYRGDEIPDLLTRIYTGGLPPLDGPVVDDVPLSESAPIRGYAGGQNYIEWLLSAAQAGIERLQQEDGFDDDKKPAALLYLLLRHAVLRSFYAAGIQLQADAGMIPSVEAAQREPSFVHVQTGETGAASSESTYAALFSPAEAITGQAGLRLGDHIAANIRLVDPDLSEQFSALERLALTPTARLERLFAEHIDTVSYRLDAWRIGLLALRLEAMRAGQKRPSGGDPPPEPRLGEAAEDDADDLAGLYLGAYGWLEPLKPEPRTLTPANLDKDLDAAIHPPPLVERAASLVETGGLAEVVGLVEAGRHAGAPLLRDSANLGLVHAPSLNHAVTAAVLRNGYLANDGRLAVDLSSRRVRLALSILEGMRGGQSIGALLGYQFERYVHDHGPLTVRALIYPLRREFPLVANQIASANPETGSAQESIAAMNVVDGRKLVERAESASAFKYPFGVSDLPRGDPSEEDVITAALAHIRDINDAVADVVLAEGVHQAVLGNYDRSAGVLDAFAKGAYPPEPEVIHTPRSGIALTLRTAIHLSPGPYPAGSTPLAIAEPALNGWLRLRLPAPAQVGCRVAFTDRATGNQRVEFISQADLGLDAIDLLYRAEAGESQDVNDLDDRILGRLYTSFAPRHDKPVEICHTESDPGTVSWFELQALLRSLRALTVASRPLTPADLMRHNDALRDEQAAVMLDAARIENARLDLNITLIPALDTLTGMLANPAVTIDSAVAEFATTLARLAAYRLPGSGTGFAYEWRAQTYSAAAKKIETLVKRWNERLVDFDARVAAYEAFIITVPPPTETDRIARLQAAEIQIAARLATPVPDSLTYRGDLDDRRAEFVAKLNNLQDLLDTPRSGLAALLDDAEAQLPLDAFDLESFDFAEIHTEIERFRLRLAENVRLLKADVEKRLARVSELLPGGAGAPTRIQEAGKALFGEDFVMVPHITLPARAADELANAWTYSLSEALTAYLTADPPGRGRDFPVDDWLHGVARVRDKMHHWENAILLGEAFQSLGAQPPELTPLQLPFIAGEPWLALEYPPDHIIDSDRLLYTAHFADPFDKTKPVVGLLVDEWTEVIPGVEETTGVAFHFDRPNAEAPQAWLLALPAAQDGAWSWNELLAAVNDALDSARLRLIEPVHFAETGYSAFLPATASAFTFPEISISNNLLRNLAIYTRYWPAQKGSSS